MSPSLLLPDALRAGVRVQAPARLHLGFLDPSASLGRAFGGVGVVIDGFETVLGITSSGADQWQAAGPAAQAELGRAQAFVHTLRERTGRRAPLALTLHEVLPAHAGFGSGTQLALAVGRAFARWQSLDVPTPTLARWLGRGRRSGVGIAGFDRGGLLVDGGPGRDGSPAPLLARHDLPEAWRILVLRDESRRGLSGAAEREAIIALTPLPRALAAELCHQVLMRVLPGVASADFADFAAGVERIQQVLGEHFAPAQSGSAWSSPAVERAVQWLRSAAGAQIGTGQSSWGPTGFAFVPSAASAQALAD